MSDAESGSIMNLVGTVTGSAVLVAFAVVALFGAAWFVRFALRQMRHP